MKLLSTYYNNEMTKESNVFFVTKNEYRVTVKSDTGTVYSAYFENESSADDFAESWVMKE